MVYNYTKPRGPIAAMYSSPGPCYALPGLTGFPNHDPRSNHLRGAQWSFGIRHRAIDSQCSPGPRYYPDSKILRDGKDGTPHFSLYSRQKEAMMFSNPGPGAYSIENSDQFVFNKAPACSLSSRTKELKPDDFPGPNRYNIDPMIGKTVRSQKKSAPAYSLSDRTKILGAAATPGAGAYKVTDLNLYREAAPKYSVTGKNQPPADNTKKPGPGAYSPEKVYMNSQSAPQYSFGIRHSQYKGEFITSADLEQ
ncbi:unnamed protein product [Schistosoma turkestanicum]|nr:unnamed protein product [Schistosoma turkestanicum]